MNEFSRRALPTRRAGHRPGAGAPGAALDAATLEKFLAVCHRRRYPSKTAIFRPGDGAGTLYYIVEGSLTVSTEDEDGRELILAYLNKGEFIGEMGLFIEPQRREVMVKSRTPCELAEIGYERLFNLFGVEPAARVPAHPVRDRRRS